KNIKHGHFYRKHNISSINIIVFLEGQSWQNKSEPIYKQNIRFMNTIMRNILARYFSISSASFIISSVRNDIYF
ncbi:hypothetical protein DX229_15060, partial [Salmonella enterica]|nr:hypothetical protein [Salmonella enterica]